MFKKRSQAVSFFPFILTNFYNFTFGMTVHGTYKKKMSKNIISMPKFNFEFLRLSFNILGAFIPNVERNIYALVL